MSVTSMWVPANDIEQHMREALRAGNQEEYFRLLARTDLLLPFAEDTAPGSNGAGSWATWATEERTHVLVFTSHDAMRACLHSHAGAFRTVSFTALADAWPHSEWWLAVDPGTPIEGYLPAWFVRQVAGGDPNLPEEPAQQQYGYEPEPQRASDYSSGGRTPQFDRFESSPFGAPDDSPRYDDPAPSSGSGGLPRREPPAAPRDSYASLPSREPSHRPDSYGSLPSREPAQPSESFDSLPSRGAERQSDPYGSLPAREPAAASSDAYPYSSRSDDDYGSAAMTGSMPRREPAEQSAPPSDWGATPAADDRSRDSGYDGRQSSASALPVPMSTSLPDWPDEEMVEAELARGASGGDTKAYLNVLLRAWAYLPVADECPPSARPGDPEFRWHTDLVDGSYTITAFTSGSRLISRYGGVPYITTTFGRLIAQWPGLEYSLYVNPSSEVGANIPGPQVTTLVTWARTQGLLQPALDMDALSAPKTPSGQPSPRSYSAPPAASSSYGSESYASTSAPPAQSYADQSYPSSPPSQSYAAPSSPREPASAPPVSAPPPATAATSMPETVTAGSTETMQKVLPHQQVAMTLERGYDRVAGFVHRYSEVSDLNTPERLYNALGLLRDGVDFSPTDESVHVIRWMGHRADLYRVAYGGNDSRGAERNGGWIVEPPPFSGDGYAPSVEGRSIVEFKVDSVRLPHGATMTRISADGRGEEVAVYDSDRREWIRSGVDASASSWDISPADDFRQEQQHA